MREWGARGWRTEGGQLRARGGCGVQWKGDRVRCGGDEWEQCVSGTGIGHWKDLARGALSLTRRAVPMLASATEAVTGDCSYTTARSAHRLTFTMVQKTHKQQEKSHEQKGHKSAKRESKGKVTLFTTWLTDPTSSSRSQSSSDGHECANSGELHEGESASIIICLNA